MLWIVREQPRDYVLEAVPPRLIFRPLVVQHQNVVVHGLITVSLEWLRPKKRRNRPVLELAPSNTTIMADPSRGYNCVGITDKRTIV